MYKAFVSLDYTERFAMLVFALPLSHIENPNPATVTERVIRREGHCISIKRLVSNKSEFR